MLAERAKAGDLQGKLADLLKQQPHLADIDTGAESQPVLGEGQLPDVDPAAVSVLKKDTMGEFHKNVLYARVLDIVKRI